MKLNEIKDNLGSTHYKKIVGRGMASGTGKTAGRGHKGQKARGSGKVRVGFEGGQNPLYRRLPKRGFNNPFKNNYFPVNVDVIEKYIESGKLDKSKDIDFASLQAAGLMKGNYDGIALLGKGSINTAVNLIVNKVSKSAEEMVTKAGGKVTVIEVKKFLPTRKQA